MGLVIVLFCARVMVSFLVLNSMPIGIVKETRLKAPIQYGAHITASMQERGLV